MSPGGAAPAPVRWTGLQAVLVDLDGTLVDTLGDFEVALNRTLADLDLPPVNRALLARTVGKGSQHLIRTVLAHQLALPEVTGLANVCAARHVDTLVAPAWERYQHHYRAVNGQHAAVFPGVEDGLRGLRAAGLPMVCLTNKPGDFARALLAAKGLAGYFRHVFGGDAFARTKPDPLPLLRSCDTLGSAPARTLMVGDSVNDAQAARAAGCPVALVTYGYNHGEPVHAVAADAHLDTLQALPGLIGR